MSRHVISLPINEPPHGRNTTMPEGAPLDAIGAPENGDLPLGRLLEMNAEAFSGAVAVRDGEQCHTYAELVDAVSAVREMLWTMGLEPGQRVPIFARRSFEFVIALLGIITGGGVAVPVSVTDPLARRRAYVSDLGLDNDIALADAEHLSLAATHNLVPLDISTWSEQQVSSAIGNTHMFTGRDPSVIVMTSGSTGRPKGVELPHSALVGYLNWLSQTMGFDENDIHLFKAEPTFVSILRQVIWPIATGGQVVIAKNPLDPRELGNLIEDTGVTIISFIPSTLRPLLAIDREPIWRSVKHLMLGGEPIDGGIIKKLRQSGCQASIHNVYAATEAPLMASYTVPEEFPLDERVPIGLPVEGVQLSVRDEMGNLVPSGEAGYLQAVGLPLALSYVGGVSENDRKWLRNLDADTGTELDTGDKAYFDQENILRFVERSTEFLKVRGYRISPADVEMALLSHPLIDQVVVVSYSETLVGDSDREILGAGICLSTSHTEEFTISLEQDFTTHLQKLVPSYMIPKRYCLLEAIPRLHSGKPDRGAASQLLQQVSLQEQTNSQYDIGVPTHDDMNYQLICLIAELIGSDPDLDRPLSEQGFDSINVISLALAIEDQFECIISVNDILTANNIEDLAQQVKSLKELDEDMGI